jgi:outer membrane biogenesis lipoprotein LolB
MKTKHLLIIFAIAGLTGCASPEERSTEQTDTNTIMAEDNAGTDTITNVDGRSGDNGAGTDTVNTAEQKAIRESGKK